MQQMMKNIYNEAKQTKVPVGDIVGGAIFGLSMSAIGVFLLTVGTPLTLVAGGLAACAGIFGLTATAVGGAGYAAGRLQLQQQPAAASESAPKKDCTSCPTQLTCGKKNEFNDEACPPTGTTPAAQPKLITIDKKM